MKTSEQGLALIKEFEGLRLSAYQDSAGVWTIGHGHTNGVRQGDTCTEAQAARWLVDDVGYAEGIVSSNVWPALNQSQFDAVVSFVFNIGPGRQGVKDGFLTLKKGGPSTLLKCLRAGDYACAANQFQYWVSAGGQKLSGLIRRREAERVLFESGDPIPTATSSPLQEARELISRALTLLNSIKG